MDPLKDLKPTLVVKLGSIVVHAEEMLSTKGHHFDVEVLKRSIADPEVQAWLKEMHTLQLVPEKR